MKKLEGEVERLRSSQENGSQENDSRERYGRFHAEWQGERHREKRTGTGTARNEVVWHTAGCPGERTREAGLCAVIQTPG